MRVLRRHGHTAATPERQDPLVRTTVRIALEASDGAELARRLLARQGTPRFVEGGRRDEARVLTWLRPYRSAVPALPDPEAGTLFANPAHPDAATFRLLTREGQQVMGEIALREDGATVAGLTLARISILMGALVEAAGRPLTITAVDWQGGLL